jgi:hypothetical protein
MAVEPTTSANNTVMKRRSPSIGRGAASAVPQFWQNLALPELAV